MRCLRLIHQRTLPLSLSRRRERERAEQVLVHLLVTHRLVGVANNPRKALKLPSQPSWAVNQLEVVLFVVVVVVLILLFVVSHKLCVGGHQFQCFLCLKLFFQRQQATWQWSLSRQRINTHYATQRAVSSPTHRLPAMSSAQSALQHVFLSLKPRPVRRVVHLQVSPRLNCTNVSIWRRRNQFSLINCRLQASSLDLHRN
jgi:hypothetical protein